jgi:uncharacterized protein (TIGR02270 family)
MKVLPAVLSQHAEEAALLLLMRKRAVGAPHYSLMNLGTLDERLNSHLDGLLIAGERGWDMCLEQLVEGTIGEVFVSGFLAFESGKPGWISKVTSVVEETPALAGGLVSALGWLTLEQAKPHIQSFLQRESPVQRRIGIASSAVHRQHPGQVLSAAARSPDVPLRAHALRAVGELHDKTLERDLTQGFADPDPECRFAAAWSGALLGSPGALAVLQEIAETGSRRASAAAGVLLRKLDSTSALAWQKRLTTKPGWLRLAITGAGVIGDPSAVPWLIPLMGQLPLARLAGEAFTSITGVDLAYRDLERKPPEDFNAGPTEDPQDENVEMDPDDNLPWPEPALVQKWWDKNRGQFQNGTRYLLGKPMTIDWLKTVLRDGRQRQRAAAALELAIRQPGTPLFNVKAPGFRQIELLGKPGPAIR